MSHHANKTSFVKGQKFLPNGKPFGYQNIGKTPWNKGLKQWPNGLPEEIKEKVSKALKGRSNTWLCKRVLSVCNECGIFFEHVPSKKRQYCSNTCANGNNAQIGSGSDNPNWKGGRTSLVRRLRNSIEYQIWRECVFARDNYTCRMCGATKKLNPHHIVPISKDIIKIFEVSNGITLCVGCHQKKHPELKLTFRGW